MADMSSLVIYMNIILWKQYKKSDAYDLILQLQSINVTYHREFVFTKIMNDE